jgi:hypothetical protein
MPRLLSAVVWLFVCLVPGLAAQSEPEEAEATDVLVVDHDFVGVNEIVRVFLQAKQVYRAELNSPDVTVAIRPPVGRGKIPRVYPHLALDTPSGMSVVEIHPDEDGEYELRSVGRAGGGVLTRLRLYRDVRESKRREAIASRPGWEIGVELAGGWHSEYNPGSVGSVAAEGWHAGADIEGCFVARNAPGLARLGMCAVGLGRESRSQAASVFWIFSEPRFRLLGKSQRGQANWELGALFRAGIGIISASAYDPIILAPGLYVARHVRAKPDGSGWSIMASYHHATVRNVNRDVGTQASERPTSERLRFGFGWYH